MQGADEKLQLICEQRTKFQLRLCRRLKRQRKVNPVLMQQFQCGWRVPRLNLDDALRKTFLKLPQHGRKDVLAGGQAGA